MFKLDVPKLRQCCTTPGPPGFEHRIRKLIAQWLEPHVDELYTDNVGNLITRIRGRDSSKRVALAAHMDEIGFIVHHIDEEGFVRFYPLGGFDPKTLTAQRVIIHGRKDILGVMGTKPIHLMREEERKQLPKIEDYFIDTGLKRDALLQYIAVGDPITRERDLVEMGDCINAKSLDNRLSVYILTEVLKELAKTTPPYDIYGTFTVQEELGLRGAYTAAHSINPDFVINLDVTIAFDVPGAQPHEYGTRLGHGVAIKIMDATVVSDPRMVRYLRQTAEKHQIPHQDELLPKGGTDTGPLQRAGRSGAISGALSIPTRHLHQVIETAHKDDILHTMQLLYHAVLDMPNFPWAEDPF